MPDDEAPFCIDDRVVRLDGVAKRADAITYVYDFGDDWHVKLEIEDRRDTQWVDAPPARLRCLDGQRAGPPDDSGGIGGYEEMLEALADRDYAEHESVITWLPRGFDPEHFDVRVVDAQLGMLEKLWSTRARRAKPAKIRSHRALDPI